MLDTNGGFGVGADGREGDLLTDTSLAAEQITFTAGGTLFAPADPAEQLYRIEKGQVRMYQVGPDDSARLVEILGPGDWAGLGALATPAGYVCRALAVTDALVLRVPVVRLRAALAQHPALAAELIQQLAGKLRAAQEAAALLVFDDCNRRLIKTLLNFSATAAAVHDDHGGVELRITHQQLAQAVGAARETVSLALTQLRQRNLLRTGRNRLLFKPAALRPLCEPNGSAEHIT